MKTRSLLPLVVILLWVMTSCGESFDVNGVDDSKEILRKIEAQTKAQATSNGENVSVSDVECYLIYRMKITQDKIVSITPYEVDENNRFVVAKLSDGRWFVFSGDYASTPVVAEGDKDNPFPMDDNADRTKMQKWLTAFSKATSEGDDVDMEEARNNRLLWLHTRRAAVSQRSSQIRSGDDTTDYIYDYVYDTLSSQIYPALTQTYWHEGSPWNATIPFLNSSMRCYAGSEIVAIAQLLYYSHFAFNKPTSIYTCNFSCTDYYNQFPYEFNFGSITTSMWDYMPSSVSGNSTYNYYVAVLYANVAKKSIVHYEVTTPTPTDPSDSYTDFPNVKYNIANCLDNYGLQTTLQGNSYDKATIMSQIQYNRPVLCYGSSVPGSKRQAYLIDGYKNYYIKETEIISDTNGIIVETNVRYYYSLIWHINSALGTSSHYYWSYETDYYSSGRWMFAWY